MDKVIIKSSQGSIIKKCGTCVYGKDKNLLQVKAPSGWVYCVLWNAQKPFNGYCPQWKN